MDPVATAEMSSRQRYLCLSVARIYSKKISDTQLCVVHPRYGRNDAQLLSCSLQVNFAYHWIIREKSFIQMDKQFQFSLRKPSSSKNFQWRVGSFRTEWTIVIFVLRAHRERVTRM